MSATSRNPPSSVLIDGATIWHDGCLDFAYLPFGGGPRICIGHRFAMMEAVLILVTMVHRFRMRLMKDRPVVPLPSITLRAGFGPCPWRPHKRAQFGFEVVHVPRFHARVHQDLRGDDLHPSCRERPAAAPAPRPSADARHVAPHGSRTRAGVNGHLPGH